MSRKRYKREEIVTKLRQVDVLVSQGHGVADAIRQIADRDTVRRELASWQRRRNAERARVKWLFDVRRAREKLGRVYPKPLSK